MLLLTDSCMHILNIVAIDMTLGSGRRLEQGIKHNFKDTRHFIVFKTTHTGTIDGLDIARLENISQKFRCCCSYFSCLDPAVE